jgi:hypothetical protein
MTELRRGVHAMWLREIHLMAILGVAKVLIAVPLREPWCPVVASPVTAGGVVVLDQAVSSGVVGTRGARQLIAGQWTV